MKVALMVPAAGGSVARSVAFPASKVVLEVDAWIWISEISFKSVVPDRSKSMPANA